jgi:3-oxoacyl-[acyl-carrier protein] reductase
MDLQLKDKVTLITGPAKGMGAAITLAFAREGAKLVLAGRDTAAIEPVAEQARALGVAAIVVPCDLTVAAQTEALGARALEAFGRIDVLVNVAGGSGPIGKTGWETTAEEFNEIVQLNMTGCFNTIHAVLPSMIERRSGKVVNVGGTFGLRGRAGRMAMIPQPRRWRRSSSLMVPPLPAASRCRRSTISMSRRCSAALQGCRRRRLSMATQQCWSQR